VALGGPIGGVVVGLSDYPSIFYVMVAPPGLAASGLPSAPRPEPPPSPRRREAAEEAAT
jgi:hypothetical protein